MTPNRIALSVALHKEIDNALRDGEITQHHSGIAHCTIEEIGHFLNNFDRLFTRVMDKIS